MITNNLNNLLSALAPAAAPQASPAAVIGSQSMRFDAALLEAAKTVRDGNGQSVEKALTPKVQQALQSLFDQLAQKPAEQLRQWAKQPGALQPTVNALAQSQGLDPEETAELSAMAPLAARSLVHALDGFKAETVSVAKLEPLGNISGPQGGEPGKPADPATALQTPAPMAPMASQPLTFEAALDIKAPDLALVHPAKDERSTTAQAAALGQVAAWVPVIVSTRTDDGSGADSAFSLSKRPVETAAPTMSQAKDLTLNTLQRAQRSGSPEANPASEPSQTSSAVQGKGAVNPIATTASTGQPIEATPSSSPALGAPVPTPGQLAAPSPAVLNEATEAPLVEAQVTAPVSSKDAPQAPSARTTVERPKSEAELNLDFKVATSSPNSPEPGIKDGTLFVLNGDGSAQGRVQVSQTSADQPVTAQLSPSTPQGAATQPAVTLDPAAVTSATVPVQVPTTAQAPASIAPQTSATTTAQAPAPAVVLAAVAPMQSTVAVSPSGVSPKATNTAEAEAINGSSGQSSALENSAGFQALKRGSQEDAPQTGLSLGQGTFRDLVAQVTKDLGIRDAAFKQVSDALASAGTETSQLVIKLKPSSLGEVQVDLSVVNGKLTAKLLASTPEVRDAFVRDLPAFKANLEAQGLRVDQVSVAVRSGSSDAGQQGQNPGQPRPQDWGMQGSQSSAAGLTANALPVSAWQSPSLDQQLFSALA